MKAQRFIQNLKSTSDCPDCGWFVACAKCSERMDFVDEDIDLRQEERKKKKK